MPTRERKEAMSTSESLSEGSRVSKVRDGQLTTENLSLEVGDVSFVYRRFGNERTAAPPLVMLQHFRGNLDSWDPALVDRLAQDREVILLNNRGVGGSTGVVPEDVTTMARDALAFIDALQLKQVDLLGFSLGGHVAQELVLLRPRLVRRVVLAGTAPQGGPDLHRWSDDVYSHATADEPGADDLLSLFFTQSEESRAKGMESIGRLYQREVDRDEPTDLATRDAQLAAITAWGIPDESKLNRLAGITQPTFVANGDNDTMMHTQNSHLLAERLPNAQLRIYPDANHGFLNQYPDQFAVDVHAFLEA
jgi:pimeloyl-ACP methyl ester carboxylesterase